MKKDLPAFAFPRIPLKDLNKWWLTQLIGRRIKFFDKFFQIVILGVISIKLNAPSILQQLQNRAAVHYNIVKLSRFNVLW